MLIDNLPIQDHTEGLISQYRYNKHPSVDTILKKPYILFVPIHTYKSFGGAW